VLQDGEMKGVLKYMGFWKSGKAPKYVDLEQNCDKRLSEKSFLEVLILAVFPIDKNME